jgi:DNA-binding NarL/FixJ family response regulator
MFSTNLNGDGRVHIQPLVHLREKAEAGNWRGGMRSADSSASCNGIPLHVVEQHSLAMCALRVILKRFPRAVFHCQVPVSLPMEVPLVFVVDAGTLTVPLGELLRLVRRECLRASVIVLNSQGPGDYLMELLFLGVAGFVAYDRAPEELARAVHAVARGGAWIEAKSLEAFSRHKFLLARGKHTGLLTEREKAVLRLLERGLCNKEISSGLRISVSTVKFHLRNVFAKIGVHDRQRAVEWARRGGPSNEAFGHASQEPLRAR